MYKIVWHPIFAHPLPEGHRFPMLKYELIPEQLLHEGTIAADNIHLPNILEEEYVRLTHDSGYWNELKNLTLSIKDQRRIGFPLNAQLLERELRIAQGTIDASLFSLKDGISFNTAGGTHHAGYNWGEGFCLLNDQAIAANYLISNKIVERILIIDLDVHQGNGTSNIFKDHNSIFTFSMHGDKNFPFRKEKSHLDIPLNDGIEDYEYLSLLSDNLSYVFNTYNPEFIYYQAGVDVLNSDKLGKLNISKSGCKERDRMVFDKCKDIGVPIQVSMGGGYSPDIKDIVDAHCNTFRVAKDLFF